MKQSEVVLYFTTIILKVCEILRAMQDVLLSAASPGTTQAIAQATEPG